MPIVPQDFRDLSRYYAEHGDEYGATEGADRLFRDLSIEPSDHLEILACLVNFWQTGGKMKIDMTKTEGPELVVAVLKHSLRASRAGSPFARDAADGDVMIAMPRSLLRRITSDLKFFSGFVGGIASPPSDNPGAGTLVDVLKKHGIAANNHATQVEACAGFVGNDDLDD